MKSLVTTTIVGLALLAATPVVHRSQSLLAQSQTPPRDEPKPQQPPSQPAPRQDPPPGRADAPSNDRPAPPPPPPPPQSTGEPELKRRNP
jgi:hypothetical protein